MIGGVGVVGRWGAPILLGMMACVHPERIIPEAEGPPSGEVLVLVEHGGQGPVLASRFEPGLGRTWAQSTEERQLELWSYDCAEDLPRKREGWWESPPCLPEPLRRLHYDFAADVWSPVLAGASTPVAFCDPCRRERLNVRPFELTQALQRPELGASLWVGPGRALFVIQERGPDGPAADTWHWSELGEPRPRPLTLVGPAPRIGALTRLADGRILAVGDQLWRLQLEPDEQAPERVTLSPWPVPHPTLPGMTERLSVALEHENGDLLLGSSAGALSWLRAGSLRPLIGPRVHSKPFHPVSMSWVGAFDHLRLAAVGLGSDFDIITDDNSIEMNVYLVINLEPTETTTIPEVSTYQLPLNPRALTAVEEDRRHRGYVVDYEGQLWRLENNDTPEMLLGAGLRGGPLAKQGDSLLIMGARGGVQLYSVRDRQRCDAEQVGRAAIISSGPDETFAIDYGADSGAWLTPRLCPVEVEE